MSLCFEGKLCFQILLVFINQCCLCMTPASYCVVAQLPTLVAVVNIHGLAWYSDSFRQISIPGSPGAFFIIESLKTTTLGWLVTFLNGRGKPLLVWMAFGLHNQGSNDLRTPIKFLLIART